MIAIALNAVILFIIIKQASDAHKSFRKEIPHLEIIKDCLDSGLTLQERRRKVSKAHRDAEARVELRRYAERMWERCGLSSVEEHYTLLRETHRV